MSPVCLIFELCSYWITLEKYLELKEKQFKDHDMNKNVTPGMCVVSRGQTAFSRILGGEKGSGATPIAVYF